LFVQPVSTRPFVVPWIMSSSKEAAAAVFILDSDSEDSSLFDWDKIRADWEREDRIQRCLESPPPKDEEEEEEEEEKEEEIPCTQPNR